jgi:hypothetical protein
MPEAVELAKAVTASIKQKKLDQQKLDQRLKDAREFMYTGSDRTNPVSPYPEFEDEYLAAKALLERHGQLLPMDAPEAEFMRKCEALFYQRRARYSLSPAY